MICLGARACASRKRSTNTRDEHARDRRPIMADAMIARGLARGGVLQPVQGRLAGQGRAIGAAGHELATEHGQNRIVPQLVVVDQVLIAKRDAEDALADQGRKGVLDLVRITSILEAGRSTKPMARSVAPSSSAPASDVIAPPVNDATTARPSTGANRSTSGLHSVGIGELLWPEPSRCSTTTLTYPEPRCTVITQGVWAARLARGGAFGRCPAL